jgi:hypothetical protein
MTKVDEDLLSYAAFSCDSSVFPQFFGCNATVEDRVG